MGMILVEDMHHHISGHQLFPYAKFQIVLPSVKDFKFIKIEIQLFTDALLWLSLYVRKNSFSNQASDVDTE